MKNTMIELVTELEKLTQTDQVKKVIETAKAGQFHDFRSSAVCGKMYAVQCFDWLVKTPGLTNVDRHAIVVMREDIIEGEYDEPFTKEDQRIVFDELDNDPSVSDRDREFFKMAMANPVD